MRRVTPRDHHERRSRLVVQKEIVVNKRIKTTLQTVVFAAMLFVGNAAWAVDIEEVRWGFDGKAVQHRFNLLSIRVSNPSGEAFDGGIALEQTNFSGQTVGAPLQQPLFLSPFSERWIQFHPFNKEQYAEWKLSWGLGPDKRYWGRSKDQRRDLNKPTFGKRAHVILNDPDALTSGKSGIKDMPENLFPPIVGATDALAGVVMDHSPSWQQPTREAFLDWLNRGGTVHILLGEDVRFPQFPPTLAELNVPLPRHRVGQGMVIRHEKTRRELTKDFVKGEILNHGKIDDKLAGEIEVQRGVNNDYGQGETVWDLDGGVLANLKEMTQPEHAWWLIYLMSFAYLLIIFPGGYLLGRLRLDYRLMIAALLGAIVLFSLGFAMVGSRGYDETTAVNTVVIAHPLPGDKYDLAGWSNAFVTGGGVYDIRHGGRGRLYSTCQSIEGVAGIIENGPDGHFVVDIPPYSARPFAFRAKVAGKPLGLKVEKFRGDQSLQELEVSFGPDVPTASVEAVAVFGDQFYRMNKKENRFVVSRNGRKANSFLKIDEYNMYGSYGGANMQFQRYNDVEESPDQLYQSAFLPLVTRDLNLQNAQTARKFYLPTDRVRVYLFAPLPVEFHMQNEHFGKQGGRVLYCIDVFKDS